VPDGRDAVPRASRPMAPRWSGRALTRCRRASARARELRIVGWLHIAHSALISSPLQTVGAGAVVLEDVGTMRSAERLEALGLALSPRNPHEYRPSIGTLVLPGHARSLLCRSSEGETPIPFRQVLQLSGSSSPGLPFTSPTLPASERIRNAPKVSQYLLGAGQHWVDQCHRAELLIDITLLVCVTPSLGQISIRRNWCNPWCRPTGSGHQIWQYRYLPAQQIYYPLSIRTRPKAGGRGDPEKDIRFCWRTPGVLAAR